MKAYSSPSFAEGSYYSCSMFCQVHGCDERTREGKPYCTKHIGQIPYIRGILDRLQSQEIEQKRVKIEGYRAIDLGGLTIQEILHHLEQHGQITIERLSRHLQLESVLLRHYLTRLQLDGFIKYGSTMRGNTVVKLCRNKRPQTDGRDSRRVVRAV